MSPDDQRILTHTSTRVSHGHAFRNALHTHSSPVRGRRFHSGAHRDHPVTGCTHDGGHDERLTGYPSSSSRAQRSNSVLSVACARLMTRGSTSLSAFRCASSINSSCREATTDFLPYFESSDPAAPIRNELVQDLRGDRLQRRVVGVFASSRHMQLLMLCLTHKIFDTLPAPHTIRREFGPEIDARRLDRPRRGCDFDRASSYPVKRTR